MSVIEEAIAESRKREAKTSPGPWDDKPATNEWLKNGPANFAFCRESRTWEPRFRDALEVAVKVIRDCPTWAPGDIDAGMTDALMAIARILDKR